MLSFLGLDIIESDKGSVEIKKHLEILSQSDWNDIVKNNYNKRVHDFIYKFLLYNTDRKIADWALVDKFI